MSRLRDSLELLRRLNEARRIGQNIAAETLTVQLDEHDSRAGYLRPIKPTHDALQPGQRSRGGRRGAK